MEEKKKSSVGVTLIIILFAIVIVVLSVLLVKINNEKNEEVQKSTALQTQVTSLNGTVGDLQNKINKINETINPSNTTINNTNTTVQTYTSSSTNNEKNTKGFTENQVKEVLASYLELKQAIGDELLNKLADKGLLTYNATENVKNDDTTITKVKYDDYKTAMLNFVSQKEFEKNWTRHDFEVDDNGYIKYGELGGGSAKYTINNIEKISDMKYTAKTTWVVIEGDSATNQDFTFEIINENGKCVIDSIS